jgi:FAD/FMN-containing dehydrogenase
MATPKAGPQADPAAAGDYDYRSDDVDNPELCAALEALVDGDVRFDSYSRQLYATDASAYELPPIGVVMPTSTDDVAAVMEYCADNEIPVLPRGGGTSLAGQTVNRAVVLDFSRYMDDILGVDPENETATAQAGMVLEALNEELEVLNAEARELEERIAENVAEILEEA